VLLFQQLGTYLLIRKMLLKLHLLQQLQSCELQQ
jgi:hypothetical protein